MHFVRNGHTVGRSVLPCPINADVHIGSYALVFGVVKGDDVCVVIVPQKALIDAVQVVIAAENVVDFPDAFVVVACGPI